MTSKDGAASRVRPQDVPRDAVAICGSVAAGFEPVLECFESNFRRDDERREIGAALCVFHRGHCVVDLHGGFAEPDRSKSWNADTLVNVYSTTKGIVALCVALLVDRGIVRYEDRVAALWPEFARCGKGSITISHLLSHQAGLPAFDEPIGLEDLFDWNGRCEALAAQNPRWVAGELSGYHPVTFGFLVGEVIRRATGRTPGQFVASELAQPLRADFCIGLPTAREGRVASIVAPKQMIDPAMIPLPAETRLAITNPALQPQWANLAAWRRAELPALNGHSSGRALARLYAVLANDGEFDGTKLLSSSSVERMSEVQSKRVDLMLGFEVEWAQGVARNGATGFFGPNPRSFGHSGWGGSFGCADPDERLSIGYVCNQMGPDLVGDTRARALCDTVYQCL